MKPERRQLFISYSHLDSAWVALLLVSADFLASDFVTRSELPPLFHAAKQEGLRILWVHLRP